MKSPRTTHRARRAKVSTTMMTTNTHEPPMPRLGMALVFCPAMQAMVAIPVDTGVIEMGEADTRIAIAAESTVIKRV